MKKAPENKSLTILVIEDNEMFRRLALEMLSGHNSSSAKNAADGMSQFKRKSPDITFLDIGLPDKSGLEILKEMKEISQEAFVVMLTASNVKADVKKSVELGADGYIIKPFSRKQIKHYIDQYLESIGHKPHED